MFKRPEVRRALARIQERLVTSQREGKTVLLKLKLRRLI